MRENRPAIPSEIKREVRQRCGFGCVICGSPIYDYEHMLEWAEVERHVADEITLLCPSHHREKTAKRLPSASVINANKTPHNLKTLVTDKHLLYYEGNEVIMRFGNTNFIIVDKGEGIKYATLVMFHYPLIYATLKEKILLLNIDLFDIEGNLVLSIVENELIISTGVWDIQYVSTKLTIRSEASDIFIEIDFITPNIIHFTRGKIYYKGITFTIHPTKGFSYVNNEISSTLTFNDCTFIGGVVGIVVHYEEPEYGGAVFIKAPRPDRI
ncbi:HNH endonuclease signature motif containing protein [Chryseobacterium indoltheticum]|uniref:HNH endonuclease n=1 Tax=Chryseobacterium indoltheticum TaxID=254 RepID=A0A3G6N5F9_9FLAO|nr:HNH endonuclease signature motif containing protein [Chryseobacterium indoltheticum]AZA60766.1 HNH endonuclease [Chryseobacterium indoltheticum]